MEHLFCWPIPAVSGQSLASNGPAVDRDLNLVFGHTEATHNKFLSSPTKYTEPSDRKFWFGHRLNCFTTLCVTTIIFAYCRM
ncbi:hypothetical protein TNCV_2350391 [Trichonephila clavipes]|uniref:Uncharacterized protein n=1 Tax=Trichonephila clavipes TaxID=2585209 RepID=A0A8X6SQF3_TRICX|nr:hypothetical protein TNCV_2350391 [Trichonephila clavipes]